VSDSESLASTKPPIHAPLAADSGGETNTRKTYAQVFTGVRQDSGDPGNFVKMMRKFYDDEGIKVFLQEIARYSRDFLTDEQDKKTVVFSDSLNIDLCLEYKHIAESAGLQPTFGVGTFLTSRSRSHSQTIFGY
jgi:nicotinate phosphoribosyltransferase